MSINKWIQMVAGTAVAAATNYSAILYAGGKGNLALLSAVIGGGSYVVAFLQNPEAPPAIPEPAKK